ncbi:MAG: GNAT family N-acetyltransferase [Acutalibacter sp.]|jgi:ElaA protein
MEWQIKTFSQLSPEELYEIIKLRVDVFVVEQNCPYHELDGKDQQALHVFGRDEDGIQAYLRVLQPGVSFPEASLGRVISQKRRQGLGTQLLNRGLEAARQWLGDGPIRIEAQTYAKTFYEQAGFRQVSEEFLEDGIPHIQMLRP